MRSEEHDRGDGSARRRLYEHVVTGEWERRIDTARQAWETGRLQQEALRREDPQSPRRSPRRNRILPISSQASRSSSVSR